MEYVVTYKLHTQIFILNLYNMVLSLLEYEMSCFIIYGLTTILQA